MRIPATEPVTEDLREAASPTLKTVSGLYRLPRAAAAGAVPESAAAMLDESPDGELEGDQAARGDLGLGSPIRPYRAELRLDVDRHFPLQIASGVFAYSLRSRTHWIAKLRRTGPDRWAGPIFYRDGAAAAFPYTEAKVAVSRAGRIARLTLSSGAGQPSITLVLRFQTPSFHPVNFEFDCAEGEQPVLGIDTCAHPNHPPSIACENLSILDVYRRAGFGVSTSPGGAVPIAGAGADARWSDQEMHDAMQSFWSRYAPRAQWAMWVFFASRHVDGKELGGVMFDDIGPQHRQGTAIFNDSFIAEPPAGDPNPQAWVRRMIFWTACHEMGHAFNLAHSWQKALDTPWIPLANDREARSFMNYPYRVQGGEPAFFADFEFRFSDAELLFLRHAPERFVQQGNAEWFDHHAFQHAAAADRATLRLQVRANRERRVYEFLEPVTLELKLTNVSGQPVLVDRRILARSEAMTVILKKRGRPARQLRPFATYCRQTDRVALLPEQSLYESLFVSAGINGWDLAEPGEYLVQVALHREGEDIVSEPMTLRVRGPQGAEEEALAGDLFTEDVGRVLAFDGSRVLGGANDALRELTERLAGRAPAVHAAVALGFSLGRAGKVMAMDPADRTRVQVREERATAEGRGLLTRALLDGAPASAETLGHVDYKDYVDRLSDLLADAGDTAAAAKAQEVLLQTLTARRVLGRPVRPEVLRVIQRRRDQYRGGERRIDVPGMERIIAGATVDPEAEVLARSPHRRGRGTRSVSRKGSAAR